MSFPTNGLCTLHKEKNFVASIGFWIRRLLSSTDSTMRLLLVRPNYISPGYEHGLRRSEYELVVGRYAQE